MALTQAIIGRADVPTQLAGLAGQPLDTALWTVDLTLGATSDYGGTGIDLTSSVIIGSGAGGLNVSQIVDVIAATVRTSGGVIRPLMPRYDAGSNKLRLLRTGSTGGTATAQACQSTNETVLASIPIPGGFFTQVGQSIAVFASGALGATGNNKTLKLNLGGTGAVGATVSGGSAVLAFAAITQNGGTFSMFANLVAGSASVQAAGGSVITSTSTNIINSVSGSGAVSMASAQQLNITGTGGATSDITLNQASFVGIPIEIVQGVDLANGDIVRMTVATV